MAGGAKELAGGAWRSSRDGALGFWRGVTYPFRGARFVYLEHPGLIRIWIWPLLLTLLCVVVVFGGAFTIYDDIAAWIWAPPENVFLWLLHFLFQMLLLLLLWAASAVVVIVLSNVLSAPFHDLLSERVEMLSGGRTAPPFSLGLLLKEALRSLGYEALKLTLYVVAMVPVLLLQLVPVVGNIVSTVVGVLFTTFYLAMDFIDWPAARRGKSNFFRFGLLWRRPASMFGFGLGVWLFVCLPVVHLLFVPAAVAGGTLFYLDLERRHGTEA